MADAKYYAWSPIVNDKGKNVKVGEVVTAAGLGIEEDDFDALVNAGAIRTVPYPKIEHNTSPREARLDELAAATEEALNNAWAESWVTPETETQPLAASEKTASK